MKPAGSAHRRGGLLGLDGRRRQSRGRAAHTEGYDLPMDQVTEQYSGMRVPGPAHRGMAQVHWKFFTRVCRTLGKSPNRRHARTLETLEICVSATRAMRASRARAL